VGNNIRVAFANEGAALGTLFQNNNAGDLQGPQCFANRVPSDLELIGKGSLRRQLSPGLKTPALSCARICSAISSKIRRDRTRWKVGSAADGDMAARVLFSSLFVRVVWALRAVRATKGMIRMSVADDTRPYIQC
jgi:hypothetical protein